MSISCYAAGALLFRMEKLKNEKSYVQFKTKKWKSKKQKKNWKRYVQIEK